MKPVKYMLLCFSDIRFSAFEIPKLRGFISPSFIFRTSLY